MECWWCLKRRYPQHVCRAAGRPRRPPRGGKKSEIWAIQRRVVRGEGGPEKRKGEKKKKEEKKRKKKKEQTTSE